jgi:hypothetical protein
MNGSTIASGGFLGGGMELPPDRVRCNFPPGNEEKLEYILLQEIGE